MKIPLQKKKNTLESGQTMLIIIVILAAMSLVSGSLLMYTGSEVLSHRNSVRKEQALNVAEAGVELAIWKLNNQQGYNGESNTTLLNGDVDVSVSDLGGNIKKIVVTSYVPNKENPTVTRIVNTQLSISSDTISFNYGVQVGNGGLEMNNGSRVKGNVFSAGNISGSNGAVIENNIIVAGNNKSIDDVTVQGNALSYSCLSPAVIQGNLTYVTGGTRTCTVQGSISTQSTQIEPIPLPISQTQIDDWKSEASSGNVINESVTITNNQTQSLGPAKITGSLTVSNGATLTLTGILYVVGDVSLSNNGKIKLSSAYGSLGGILISDNAISVSNNGILEGSGQSSSYILLLSTYNSSSAITIGNNATGAIFYASSGTIMVNNNAKVKGLTGYKIKLNNNAIVEYETGLASLLFTSGPGGAWEFIKGTYSIGR